MGNDFTCKTTGIRRIGLCNIRHVSDLKKNLIYLGFLMQMDRITSPKVGL